MQTQRAFTLKFAMVHACVASQWLIEYHATISQREDVSSTYHKQCLFTFQQHWLLQSVCSIGYCQNVSINQTWILFLQLSCNVANKIFYWPMVFTTGAGSLFPHVDQVSSRWPAWSWAGEKQRFAGRSTTCLFSTCRCWYCDASRLQWWRERRYHNSIATINPKRDLKSADLRCYASSSQSFETIHWAQTNTIDVWLAHESLHIPSLPSCSWKWTRPSEARSPVSNNSSMNTWWTFSMVCLWTSLLLELYTLLLW